MATPITIRFLYLGGLDSDDRDLKAYKAWFKAEGEQQLGRNPRRQHLLHVSQLLLEGARDKAYDGLIIIATEPVASELEDALAPEIGTLLIGKIVRDDSGLERAATYDPPEMRH